MEEKGGKLYNQKHMWIIALIGVIGVALIVFGNSGFREADKTESSQDTAAEILGYTEILENKVRAMVREISGNEAAVLITLECSNESVYADNLKESEEIASGDMVSHSYEREYLIISGEGGEEGLLLREIYPKIRGIAVVCNGGNEPSRQLEIIKLLSVAFGISASKVYVTGGE